MTTRRGLIGAGLGGLLLSGCERVNRSPAVQATIGKGQDLTFHAQRLLLSGQPLAREFSPSQVSPVFKVNGTRHPTSDAYNAFLARDFADWRLAIDGLVMIPMQLSLAELRAMPSRTQITRHDCVEGWSAIGGWTGVQLGRVLRRVGLRSEARYVVFHCADNLGGPGDGGLYYESIDLFDAFHPQTLLAYAMNGETLPVEHGAPLRLRVERQLGYKQAKYIMRIEVVDRLAGFGGGKGGFWEDRGYEWYAGI